MSFGDHLEELRKCVFFAIGGIVPIFFIAFYYSKELVQLVTYPVRHALRNAHLSESLQSTGVFETFNASILMATVVTVILGSPWILWQLWRFIAPGLHDFERRFIYILLPLSALLTVMSVAFCYAIVLPIILTFMIEWGKMSELQTSVTAPLPQGVQLPVVPILEHDPPEPQQGAMWFSKDEQRLKMAIPVDGGKTLVLGVELNPPATITPGYRIQEYLSMLITMMLSFAGAFQTPVVVLMLGWVGIIDSEFLSKFRKHAVLGSLIAGALLTPGDMLSFVLVTVPIYLLYELGGLLLRILPASRVARGFWGRKPGPDDDMSEGPSKPDGQGATQAPALPAPPEPSRKPAVHGPVTEPPHEHGDGGV